MYTGHYKKQRSIIAWFLSLIMLLSLFGGFNFQVKAAESSSTKFVEVKTLEESGDYIIAAVEDDSTVNAITLNEKNITSTTLEVNSEDDSVDVSNSNLIWTYDKSAKTFKCGSRFLYPTSKKAGTSSSSSRKFSFANGILSFETSSSTGYMAYSADGFIYAEGDDGLAAASAFRLFKKEASAEPEPDSTTFVEVSKFDSAKSDDYVVAAEGEDGKLHAITLNGSKITSSEITMNADGKSVDVSDSNQIWKYNISDKSLECDGKFLYPYQKKAQIYDGYKRAFDFAEGILSFETSSSTGYMAYSADGFIYAEGDDGLAAASTFRLFKKEGSSEPEPETTTFVEVSKFDSAKSDDYVVAAEGEDGKLHAITLSGSKITSSEITLNADGKSVDISDSNQIWKYNISDKSLECDGKFLYPYQKKAQIYDGYKRAFDFAEGILSFETSSSTGYMAYSADGFIYAEGDDGLAAASTFRLFKKEGSSEPEPDSTTFVEVSTFNSTKSDDYVVAAEGENGKLHAITLNGSKITSSEITMNADGKSVDVSDSNQIWKYNISDKSLECDGKFLYPYQKKAQIYDGYKRAFDFAEGILSFETSSSTGYMAYSADGFIYAEGDDGLAAASTFHLFGKEGSSSETTAVTGVSLDKETLDMETEETYQLTETVAPENATNKKVTWSSDKESVAKVSETGLVTAVGAGEANITVTTVDGEKTATCKVKVTQAVTAKYELVDTIQAGGEYLIVSTNQAGSGFALKNNGGSSGGTAMDSYGVTIKDGTQAYIETSATNVVWKATTTGTGIKLTNGSDYLEGKSGKVAIFTSSQYDDRFWTYSSNQLKYNNSYSVYYNNGFAYAQNSSEKVYLYVKEGSVVNVPVTGVSLDKETLDMETEETYQLTETVAPENATNKKVTWSSDKESVATVSETGLITAVGAGEANITVTTVDGEKTASCKVSVTKAATSVYKLVDSLRADGEYLIVNINDAGSAFAVKNTGGSSDGTAMKSRAVTVKAASDEVDTPYIETASKDIIWKADSIDGGFKLINEGDYLEGYHGNVYIFNDKKNEYVWNYTDGSQLVNTGSESNTYVVYYDNNNFTFKSDGTGGEVYIYEKVGTTPPAPEKVKVTFDVQGHGTATAPAAQDVEKGGKVTKPEDPTDDEYDFGGWFQEAECETEWDFDQDIVSGPTTIYALWTKGIDTDKRVAKKEIDKIVTDNFESYNLAVQSELNSLAYDYKKAIDDAETEEAVQDALNEFKDKQAELMTTEALYSAITDFNQTVAEYSGKFYDVQQTEFDKLVSGTDGIESELLNAITKTDVANALRTFDEKVKEIPTKKDIDETINKLDKAFPADELAKYPADQQKKITELLNNAKDDVKKATTKTEINNVVSSFETEAGKIKKEADAKATNEAKNNANEQIDKAVSTDNLAKYKADEQNKIKDLANKYKDSIAKAATVAEVNKLLKDFNAEVAKLKTAAQINQNDAALKTQVQKTAVKIKAPKTGKRKATAKWTANKLFDGYQVNYKIKGKGKKWKKVTVKGATKTKKVIKKLKKGKKYQIKVRGYKTIAGAKVYGKFSKTKVTKKIK